MPPSPPAPLRPSPRPLQDRASAAHPVAAAAASPLTWTAEREARLLYVQAQLGKAQARWSEEQDLWIDEVHHLEDLKRKCLKAGKKATARGRANSVAAIWKAKTWGSSSSTSKYPSAETVGENSSALMEDELEEAVGEEEGGESTSGSKSFTSLFRTISLTGNKDRSEQGSRRNTIDVGQSLRASLPVMPEHGYPGAEAKGKGKVLQKRRGSGK